MAKRLGFKPTMRETLLANERATRYYALMAGKEPPPSKVAPVKERAAPRDLEGPVVAAISELLAVHPRVIWALRVNSGMASYEQKSGKYAPVYFHRWLKPKSGMRMPDFFGMVTYFCPHKTIIPIAIEAKAPGWKKPTDQREREQAAFLQMIRDAGGIGIFATSAEDVANALR